MTPTHQRSSCVLPRQSKAADPQARRVDDGADARHLHYVTYSLAMRLPDLVSIEAVTFDDGRTGLILYARAQLGSSDFGANLRRLHS